VRPWVRDEMHTLTADHAVELDAKVDAAVAAAAAAAAQAGLRVHHFCVLPRHSTRFRPSFLESNDIL